MLTNANDAVSYQTEQEFVFANLSKRNNQGKQHAKIVLALSKLQTEHFHLSINI